MLSYIVIPKLVNSVSFTFSVTVVRDSLKWFDMSTHVDQEQSLIITPVASMLDGCEFVVLYIALNAWFFFLPAALRRKA